MLKKNSYHYYPELLHFPFTTGEIIMEILLCIAGLISFGGLFFKFHILLIVVGLAFLAFAVGHIIYKLNVRTKFSGSCKGIKYVNIESKKIFYDQFELALKVLTKVLSIHYSLFEGNIEVAKKKILPALKDCVVVFVDDIDENAFVERFFKSSIEYKLLAGYSWGRYICVVIPNGPPIEETILLKSAFIHELCHTLITKKVLDIHPNNAHDWFRKHHIDDSVYQINLVKYCRKFEL